MTSAPIDALPESAGPCGTCRRLAARMEERPAGLLCLECFQRTRQMSALVPRDERLPFGLSGMATMPLMPTRQAAHRRAMLAHLSAQREPVPMSSREPEFS